RVLADFLFNIAEPRQNRRPILVAYGGVNRPHDLVITDAEVAQKTRERLKLHRQRPRHQWHRFRDRLSASIINDCLWQHRLGFCPLTSSCQNASLAASDDCLARARRVYRGWI